MKNIEQQLEDEKRRVQAIIDLLDESLVKIGVEPNNYSVTGKIDILLTKAQQGIQTKDKNLCVICGRPEYSHGPKGHDFRKKPSE